MLYILTNTGLKPLKRLSESDLGNRPAQQQKIAFLEDVEGKIVRRLILSS